MKVIRGIKNIKQKFKRPVLAIGMFDGVHLAHQKIIKAVIRQARVLKGTSMVLTFCPHPLRILKGRYATPMIASLQHRIDLIKQLGIDVCLLLDFTKKFSCICAEDFVKHILVNSIGVNYIIVGEGFRFGKNKHGSFSLFKKLSLNYGFKIRQVKTIKLNGQPVSSSKIRSLIQKGKVNKVNKFLGRNFSLCGKVRRGSARGRILGYPTANIEPSRELVPLRGVYAVVVKLNSKFLPGIVNIGARPTFHSKTNAYNTIEVHIFNFHNKIYGKKLEILFVERIRAEKKFPSPQALLKQIKKDELKAKKVFTPQI